MDQHQSKKRDQFLHQYTKHEDSLRGFVRSLVPTLDDAKEVMQETATVLWRKFDELDSIDNFRRWAFGVAKFEILAFRRDKARDRHVFSEDLMQLLSEEAEQEVDKNKSEIEALELCLQKLTPENRQLVKLAYTSNVRIDHIAHSMKRTPMSLYKALHRIRVTLVHCIQKRLKHEEEIR